MANRYKRHFVPSIEAITPASNEVIIDVYDVLRVYDVRCGARQHAIKKILMAGQRGVKDAVQDLQEARDAIDRAIQITEAK